MITKDYPGKQAGNPGEDATPAEAKRIPSTIELRQLNHEFAFNRSRRKGSAQITMPYSNIKTKMNMAS
jgi:hypothetical protein